MFLASHWNIGARAATEAMPEAVTLACTAGAGALMGAWALYRAGKYTLSPYNQFRSVGKLYRVILYPIVGGPGVEIGDNHSVKCSSTGLRFDRLRDREFALVDDSGSIITRDSRLSRLDIEFDTDKNVITLSGGSATSSLRLDVSATDADSCGEMSVRYPSGDIGRATRLFSDEIHGWFRELLQNNAVSLVRLHPGDNKLSANVEILSTASVRDVTQRVIRLHEKFDDDPLSYKHFQPNILVSNDRPFSEDAWKYVRVGDKATLRFHRRIAREKFALPCNLDEKAAALKEPLATLKAFRVDYSEAAEKYEKHPLMGIHGHTEQSGFMRVGDSVLAIISPNDLL